MLGAQSRWALSLVGCSVLLGAQSCWALVLPIYNTDVFVRRCAVQTVPEDEVVSSAILKVAAGTPLLAASLSLDALLSEVGYVAL